MEAGWRIEGGNKGTNEGQVGQEFARMDLIKILPETIEYSRAVVGNMGWSSIPFENYILEKLKLVVFFLPFTVIVLYNLYTTCNILWKII